MDQAIIDNKSRILKDELVDRLESESSLSIAAPKFSLYAWRALRDQLAQVSRFRFLYTQDAFLPSRTPKEQREFYIPRRERERSLLGTEYEVRLRNELTQKADAHACAAWIREKAEFRSVDGACSAMPSLTVEQPDDTVSYVTLMSGFTSHELGIDSSSTPTMLIRQDTGSSRALLGSFDVAWDASAAQDVTEAIVDSMQAMYRENAPELLYFTALSRIFEGYLDDLNEGDIANEKTGFKESAVWNALYDFQRDAVLAIINKLNTFGGCILADSVGLGKTFTALAVIKYFESRNLRVLVLCPKKLSDNWVTYRSNVVNNPLVSDNLRYDVAYHTDLSRGRGKTITGLDIKTANWGAYDLVVIDESHSFRNGTDSAAKDDDRPNRYQRLVNKIIDEGVDTKVLMLSATPVNTRFRDLRNQLSLAYHNKRESWVERLGVHAGLDDVFKNAQKAYGMWSKLPVEGRTTQELANLLDSDFFTVLDQVTVARSRRHIQRYYDVNAIGPFPKRNKPISIRAQLTARQPGVAYHDIYDELDKLILAVYMPSRYILPSKLKKNFTDKDGNLTTGGRETGVRRLMAANLLKRLESSVYSFRKTLTKVIEAMQAQYDRIEEFKQTGRDVLAEEAGVAADDLDADDEELLEDYASDGHQVYHLRDMDWRSWQADIHGDLLIAKALLELVEDIDPAHDAKLAELKALIREKTARPLNPGNMKVIIFTAFADTAEYLYEHLSTFAKGELGLESAIVTGSKGARITIKRLPADITSIITCFSPLSKNRDKVMPDHVADNIDLLIATDCISEGQNLQDCDYLVNYDIHWNPVRIVQRFGRVDRIGSKNAVIQLVNFWPDVELDEYINLKGRVEARMKALVMTSTGDDNYIDTDDTGDLEYREQQLRQMQNDVVDLEDASGGVSITDLGLNEFRMDLVAYAHDHPELEAQPSGIDAVVAGDVPGIAFVLRNVNGGVNIEGKNQLHPFYLVYLADDGEVLHTHLDPKATLDEMRMLCRGKAEPDAALCRAYNRATKDGTDMRHASELLGKAIASIIDAKQESDVDSLFTGGTTTFGEGDVKGLDDFELICFLVVRPAC